MGLMGACRTNELHSMKIEDIEDYNGALIVNIPVTKTKTSRSFTVSGEFYEICRKYLSLRPPHATSNSLFLNYQNGKCTIQKVGINKLAAMGKQIAMFLKLKDPELYTGHSFRRSSATICVSGGGDIAAVKKLGGWKSTTVAEGYIDDNINNKLERGRKIVEAINKNNCTIQSVNNITSTTTTGSTTYNTTGKENPPVTFNNCSNITIHYNYHVDKN